MLGWAYYGASVRGVGHELAGDPCQDAHGFREVPLPDDQVALVLAVSDGAGSALFGGVGAHLVVRTWLDVAGESLMARSAEGVGLAASDAHQMIEAVRARVQAESKSQERPFAEFAATLLGLVVTPTSTLVLQLGDGAVVLQYGVQGPYGLAFQPHRGEFINSTVFVTSDQALQEYDVAILGPIAGAVVVTDGLEPLATVAGGTAPHAPFITPFLTPLASASPGERRELSDSTTQWARTSQVRTRVDDDLTLSCVMRVSP